MQRLHHASHTQSGQLSARQIDKVRDVQGRRISGRFTRIMLRINSWIRRIELPHWCFTADPINTKHCGYLGIFYSSFDETMSMHRWSHRASFDSSFPLTRVLSMFPIRLSGKNRIDRSKYEWAAAWQFLWIILCTDNATVSILRFLRFDFIASRGRGNWKILVISFDCENSANRSYRVRVGKRFERNVCYCQMYYTRCLTV